GAVVAAATVKDTDGNTVDTSDFFPPRGQDDEAEAADEGSVKADESDEADAEK
ncbi:MAG TPA: trigger factor, partial [Mycobacterium sp.]